MIIYDYSLLTCPVSMMGTIAEFAEAEKGRSGKWKRRREQATGGVLIGGGVLTGKQALDSGLPRLAGVRLERHATSKKSAKAILDGSGYLDPSYGGNPEGVTKQMRLPEEFLDRSKGHIFISGRNSNHPDWGKRNFLSPIEDVLTRKIQVAGYKGSKSGPITDSDVKHGKYFLDAALERALKITKDKGGMDEKQYNKFVKQIKNPPPQKRIDAIKRKIESLAEITEKEGGNYYKIRGEWSEKKSERLWKLIDAMHEQQGIKDYHDRAGTMAAQAAKLVKSPPLGFLGVGKELYIPGDDKFFEDTNRFLFDPDDPFSFRPPFLGRGNALKSTEKVKVFGNRYSATAHAIKEHGLMNLIKANPKRVAAGGAILLGGGLLAGGQIRSGINKLRGEQPDRKRNPNEKIKVKGFTRKGKLVKGYSRRLGD